MGRSPFSHSLCGRTRDNDVSSSVSADYLVKSTNDSATAYCYLKNVNCDSLQDGLYIDKLLVSPCSGNIVVNSPQFLLS